MVRSGYAGVGREVPLAVFEAEAREAPSWVVDCLSSQLVDVVGLDVAWGAVQLGVTSGGLAAGSLPGGAAVVRVEHMARDRLEEALEDIVAVGDNTWAAVAAIAPGAARTCCAHVDHVWKVMRQTRVN